MLEFQTDVGSTFDNSATYAAQNFRIGINGSNNHFEALELRLKGQRTGPPNVWPVAFARRSVPLIVSTWKQRNTRTGIGSPGFMRSTGRDVSFVVSARRFVRSMR